SLLGSVANTNFILRRLATSMTEITFWIGTVLSAYNMIVTSSPGVISDCKRSSNASNGTTCLSTWYNRSPVMHTVTVFLATDCSPALDIGSKSMTTCRLATAEANRKNNIKKNMISLSAAVCTSAVGLFLLFRKFILISCQ